jgi:OTU domain-containing protein 3
VFLRKRKLPTRIKQIVGDGNCLFRALGDQMGIEHRHLEIRRNICNYMYNNPENFRKFILSDQSFEEYVYQMVSIIVLYQN